MRTLQNNFTTPEQSKRLLKIGVPSDSANLFYSKFECETFENRPTLCYDKKYSDIVPDGYEKDYLPCWSVGRLIEICLSVFETHYFAPKAIKITTTSLYGAGLTEDCVRKLEELHKSYSVDFTKLEE